MTLKIVQLFAHFSTESNDDEEWGMKKNIGVFTALFGVVTYLLYGLLFLNFNETPSGLIAIGVIFLYLINILSFKIFHHYAIFWIIGTIIHFLAISLIHVSLGGFAQSGMIILYLFVVPVQTIISYKPGYGITAFMAGAIIIIILAYLLPDYLRNSNNIPTAVITALFVANSLGITMYMSLGVLYFVWRNNILTADLNSERDELKVRNTIIENELSMARKIQEQLIPSESPTDFIDFLYKPMEQVGGDFFDFITFPDSDKIGIFLSDVSGHGVPAAFITSMIKTTILQSGDQIESPSELLLYINQMLQEQTAGNFITAFYGIYNPATKTIIYANAGHPQPYIITSENVTRLKKGKNTAIAIFPNVFLEKSNKAYVNFEDKLPEGSKLLLYTDGLTETCPINNQEPFFENANMLDIFKEFHNNKCDSFLKNLYIKFADFRGGESFEDDVCIICLDAN